jgi:site-specific DNA recombinase
MTDVVLYARLSVSTEESVSIERQLVSGRQYAAARGWTVSAEFTDDGVSASKVRPEFRPGWRALLAYVAEHPTHAAVAWKVDRIARSVLDFLNADSALREHDSGIVCVEQAIDMTTPEGRGFATMLAVFAEMEAAGIAARVKDARRALLKAGRRAGGRPPYGWTNVKNPDGPGLVLAQDPATIGYVKEAAERALRGDSLYSITVWLTESGAKPSARRKPGSAKDAPKVHARWHEASVETILRNPVLAGLTPYAPGRQPGSVQDPWSVVTDEDGVPIVDESVKVVDVDEWRRLLGMLDSAKRPGSRPRQGKTPSLLSRLLRCGTCGKALHRSTSGGGFDGFRCANRECDRQASVNRARAEEYVIGRVLAERGETRQHEFRQVSVDSNALAAIGQALREAGAAFANTRDPEERARLLKRMDTLQAREDEARLTVNVTKPLVSPTRGQATWGEEFTAALDAKEVETAAMLLREQVEYVTVRPTGQNARAAMADRADIEWVPLGDRDAA